MRNRGRPQKYPERDTAEERKKLVELAARLFEVPYDDRALRDPDAPSLNEVARCMDITILKARKLLITDRTFQPKPTNFNFFSSAHRTFSRIDHILGHKSSLGKFKKIEIIPSIFSDHNAVRLDLNYRRKTIKNSNI